MQEAQENKKVVVDDGTVEIDTGGETETTIELKDESPERNDCCKSRSSSG